MVFAPANKINIVAACTTIKKALPKAPSPSMVLAIWEITVGVPDSYGMA
ncbi:unannotated protein [freshwater metagenome]|uniref:Unannotated protein n=1 Tax=freshwater metagenome TaxID=449393 RepID=A0A6J6VBL1_9ZZZZ